jgi:hypothetical protein
MENPSKMDDLGPILGNLQMCIQLNWNDDPIFWKDEDPFFEANSWGVNDEFYPLAR